MTNVALCRDPIRLRFSVLWFCGCDGLQQFELSLIVVQRLFWTFLNQEHVTDSRIAGGETEVKKRIRNTTIELFENVTCAGVVAHCIFPQATFHKVIP